VFTVFPSSLVRRGDHARSQERETLWSDGGVPSVSYVTHNRSFVRPFVVDLFREKNDTGL
jgi:hypothetical protein